MHVKNPAQELVKMANNIAAYFASEPQQADAIAGMIDHIQKAWEPRMRAQMNRYLEDHNGEGLSPLALEALRKLAA